MGAKSSFVWDSGKELVNIEKHGINFTTASRVFKDPERRIYIDSKHSQKEKRFFCVGKVENKILTVRFIYRAGQIRIFGAGWWRKGEKHYGKKNERPK